ncbi:MAG: TolC family protein [Phycisphaerales bacterium]|nr:TolC family protein [Phycisphaerales bacterium]
MREALGSADLEPIPQFPDEDYLKHEDVPAHPQSSFRESDGVLMINMTDALRMAAAGNREYQTQKEDVFRTALRLDLADQNFRLTWDGLITNTTNADLSGPPDTFDNRTQGTLGLTQRLKNGITFNTALTMNLVALLTGNKPSARGITGDASISLPLMRGSGEFIVTEPLTQAQRDLVYAIYRFERFKRTFAVRVFNEYLSVLQQYDQVRNAEDNYRRLVTSTRRAQRLQEAGRLKPIEVDQSRQNELRSRASWIGSQQSLARRLDSFKQLLGLPVDARIEMDRSVLEGMYQRAKDWGDKLDREEGPTEVPGADVPVVLEPANTQDRGPYELEERQSILLALRNRLDLKIAVGRVLDRQRNTAVAADRLRADLTLLARGSAGALAGTDGENKRLEPGDGNYSTVLSLDLPLERTGERNSYRFSLIDLEAAIRSLQENEDTVKLEIRNNLRRLLEQRENLRIQSRALTLAERRVNSTNLFLEAGRAQIRDLLEAQDALVTAQNAFTSAMVSYRVAELEMQRDLEVLEVGDDGSVLEVDPSTFTAIPPAAQPNAVIEGTNNDDAMTPMEAPPVEAPADQGVQP